MPSATATTRLLLLAALCSLAACTSLKIEATNFLVEMDENSEELGPRYLLKKQYIITVQCSMAASDNSVLQGPEIIWHMENSTDTLDEFRFHAVGSLSAGNTNFTSVLTLRRPNNEDVANYTCTGTASGLANVTGTAQIQSRPLVVAKVGSIKTFDYSIWPGDDLLIECEAEGNPTGSVGWYRKSADGVEVSLQNSSVLNLTDLSYERDRGYITCRSRNKFGENSAQIYLRVKNPKAYLPPLLIIIAEAVIIAAVVTAYELYMRKKRSQWNTAEGAAYKTD